MNTQSKTPRARRTDIGAFDKWLEESKRDFIKVTMNFAIPPFQGKLQADVTIIEIDPSMLLVEFSDGDSFWVARDIIVSAAFAEPE